MSVVEISALMLFLALVCVVVWLPFSNKSTISRYNSGGCTYVTGAQPSETITGTGTITTVWPLLVNENMIERAPDSVSPVQMNVLLEYDNKDINEMSLDKCISKFNLDSDT